MFLFPFKNPKAHHTIGDERAEELYGIEAGILSAEEQKALTIAVETLEEKLALDIRIIRVGGIVALPFAYVILGTIQNEMHARTLLDEIYYRVKHQTGKIPLHTEGTEHLRWIVLDYGDFVIHLMREEIRQYYDLEGLWNDCPQMSGEEFLSRIRSLSRNSS